MNKKDKIKELVEEYLSNSDYYLLDIKIASGNIITVEIDNDEGVEINYCALLSKHIESQLDREVEDFELTVTSTGLSTPFKTPRQYRKFIGKEIEILTKKGIKQYATLKSADEKGFVAETTKMEKPEGAKRKIKVKEDISFKYDDVKYTKYKIRF